jgi:hypothetical protein
MRAAVLEWRTFPPSSSLVLSPVPACLQEKKRGLIEGGIRHPLYDAADVVAWIHRRLREEGYRGEAIHELYCDEVQVRSGRKCKAQGLTMHPLGGKKPS